MIENKSDEEWVGGDGGPLVVLQAGALPHWEGAVNFDQSIMGGGTLETDYDVICNCKNHHLRRHNRDMLVLDDSEWCARIYQLENGVIVVEQPYYDSPDTIKQITESQPTQSFSIMIEDNLLRLLVGADSANGDQYGFSEIEITSGTKRCDVYQFDNVFAIKISPE